MTEIALFITYIASACSMAAMRWKAGRTDALRGGDCYREGSTAAQDHRGPGGDGSY